MINYYSNLPEHRKNYLGYIRKLLTRWIECEIPGISHDCLKILQQLRIKGNRKGEATRTHDPEHGAFSDIEFESLHTCLWATYNRGEIRRDDFLLCLLFLMFGIRPKQCASLKTCDLQTICRSEDYIEYVLFVPRVKQRETSAREEFTPRSLNSKIGELLAEQVADIHKHFSQLCKLEHAPLFPAQRRANNYQQGFEFHRSSGSISYKFKSILSSLTVHSERTGQPLNITPTRARRTLGTRAAAEGYGELVIAELLDHSDAQNAGVYVQAIPEFLERLDQALALQLAPRVQAFAGTLITEVQAKQVGKSLHKVCSPYSDEKRPIVGTCGKHGFCESLAPIACYTCINFQAWLDGPHMSILKYLLQERERLQKVADPRISRVNDRTIFAVAQIVEMCRELKMKEGTYQ